MDGESAGAVQAKVKEITRRNRGHRVQDVIDELRRYVTGWMNYFGISHTYKVVLELDDWLRRRVRSTTGSSGNNLARAGGT